MKKIAIALSVLYVAGTSCATGKQIIDVTNDDALVDASTFIARLTNIPERKLPLEQEVKEFIEGPLADEFLLAAYGNMKGMEKSEDVANVLQLWGCTSTQSSEPLEINKNFGIKYPLTCKSMVRSTILTMIEKDIQNKAAEQVKKLSQKELDAFYKIRNKEQWREGWLNDQNITPEDEMNAVKLIGLKAYEESIAENILKAREKKKLIQEAKKHFEVHFDPSLAKTLANEIRESRTKYAR